MDLHDRKTWESYDVRGYVSLKLETVRDFIPEDVKIILDAGCGNGIITNALDGDFDVLGFDISMAALNHVTAPKLQGSITDMPFDTKSFDLVMCHEVLEHLDDHDLLLALSEIKRCASKYVMISVPNQETLSFTLVKCTSCGAIFHAYGHLHSFTLDYLNEQMAPAFKLQKQRVFGPKQARVPNWLVQYRQAKLDQWFHPTFHLSCPKCNGSKFHHKQNIFTMASNIVARMISPKRPYWLLAIYKRNLINER